MQATVNRSAVNQKKMSCSMSQQSRDVQQLQSQHKTDTVQLESLRQELTEKKADVSSLQERVSTRFENKEGYYNVLFLPLLR